MKQPKQITQILLSPVGLVMMLFFCVTAFNASAQNIIDQITENTSQARYRETGGDNADCASNSAVTTPVRAGSRAFRHYVRNCGDRAELAGVTTEIGGTYWYGWSVYLPSNWQVTNKSNIINQWAAYPAVPGRQGNFPCGGNGHKITLGGGTTLRYDLQHDSSSGDQCDQYNVLSTVEMRGKWTDFVMHVKWTGNSDGFLRLSYRVDGGAWVMNKINYTGATWWNDEDKGPYFKMGYYIGIGSRGWSPSSVTVYTDEYRLGNANAGFAAVAPGGSSEPPPSSSQITGLRLVDGDTNQPITGFDPLVNNAVINLAALPTRRLNLCATTGSAVGSIRFDYDSSSIYHTENAAPYCLAGDGSGYRPWTPRVGTHTVRATPYSGSEASGTAGTTFERTFTVVDGTTPPNGAVINESFDQASDINHLTVLGGGVWQVASGKLVLSDPANGSSSAGNANFIVHNTSVADNDFTLTTEARVAATSSSWNDFSVVFGFTDVNNYYYASFNESNDSNTSGIFRVTNGATTQIADTPTLIAANTTYNIRIERRGSTIHVFLNNQEIATATDSSFAGGGRVGYGTRNDAAIFDNLKVTR